MIAQVNRNSNAHRQDIHKYQVVIGGMPLEVISLPGMPAWEQNSAAARLIADNVEFNPSDHVILFGFDQGALAAYLRRILSAGELTIFDHNYTSLEATKLTLSANQAGPTSIIPGIDLPPDYKGKYGAAVIQIPKGRLLARRWLVQAYNALCVDGNLYLVGPNRAGILSVIKDAQAMFGLGRVLAYKKGNRLAHFIKTTTSLPTPDWTQYPGIAPNTWFEFSISLPENSFTIHSLPGVFSFDHLDQGTKLLMDTVQIPPGAKILDAGCGYGILGLFAAVQGAGVIHMIDNNMLAVASASETLSLNGISNAQVFAGDLLDQSLLENYDLILSNPPFHTGHAVDYQTAQALIINSYRALNLGGRVIIVANRFIRYNRLIQEIFGNVSFLAESSKYHVLSGLKSSQQR